MTQTALPKAPPRTVIALVASAGGLHRLERILAELPRSLGAAVLVVLHLDRHHRSRLAEILASVSPLTTNVAHSGDLLEAGTAYVAPPDRHLRVTAGNRLALSEDPPIHYLRPSGDVLLLSMAEHIGQGAVAVILSGTGSDGAEGCRAIKAAGGIVIAEDEATAPFGGMPHAAIATGQVDWVLPLAEIAPMLVQLTEPGNAA